MGKMNPEEIARMMGMKKVKPASPKKTPEEWAKLFGATVVGQVPNLGGGPLGAAHLAHIYQQRMAEVRADESLRSLGLKQNAIQSLVRMAAKTSTPDHRVTPAEVAVQLLEEALANRREAV